MIFKGKGIVCILSFELAQRDMVFVGLGSLVLATVDVMEDSPGYVHLLLNFFHWFESRCNFWEINPLSCLSLVNL